MNQLLSDDQPTTDKTVQLTKGGTLALATN